MRKQNVFADLSIVRNPEKIELDIYRDDAELLKRFVTFKQESLKGVVTLAEIFNRLTKVFYNDPDFAKHMGVHVRQSAKSPKTSLRKET